MLWLRGKIVYWGVEYDRHFQITLENLYPLQFKTWKGKGMKLQTLQISCGSGLVYDETNEKKASF